MALRCVLDYDDKAAQALSHDILYKVWISLFFAAGLYDWWPHQAWPASRAVNTLQEGKSYRSDWTIGTKPAFLVPPNESHNEKHLMFGLIGFTPRLLEAEGLHHPRLSHVHSVLPWLHWCTPTCSWLRIFMRISWRYPAVGESMLQENTYML